jgi:drug/metabolite transporter (DMT)-like permease
LSHSLPSHLLFPLFSSVVFVIGMMFAKNAITRGANPWTSTFLANLCLALSWLIFGFVRNEWLPIAGWWQASLVGLTFVLGQMFTYLAFQYGDLSVATPIFGVKVLIVAAMIAVFADEPVPGRVWIGALLATAGIGFIQAGTRSQSSTSGLTPRKATLTILMALAAATALSLFDVGLQTWGKRWGAETFLPVMFVATGVLSCGFLPWVDRPAQLIKRKLLWPLIIGALLMAVQAMSMSWSLSAFGDATRINIVYALRGLWAVVLSWGLARLFGGHEAHHSRQVMLLRLVGAVLLTASVIVALLAD